MSVSTFGGLLFLAGGIALFVVGILYMAARERASAKPRHTVLTFERSRTALGKIHRAEARLRHAARAKARALHPSGRQSGGAPAPGRATKPTETKRPARHRRSA